jgi:hypothetical protein
MSWRAVYSCLVLAWITLSCQKTPPAAMKAATGRQMRATVVTIRTTLQPSNRTTKHTIVIGPDGARSTDEAGTWRLYDFKQNRVTFVDDIEKTFRVEPLATIVERRRRRMLSAPPGDLPASTARATGESRAILGIPASQIIVQQGGYQRQLWFARHPQIPEQLFSMMHVSDATFVPRRAVQQADAFLTAARGFPLVDHAEVSYGASKMVVDRVVESVQQRDVSPDLLRVPRHYRESAATAPAARRPSASSLPPDQTARGVESRFF